MPQPAQPQAADRFVGRFRELAMLRAAYREAAVGDARLVLVAGEPGIGKTELARAFAREAGTGGALVLWGTAWEDGGAPPYWPWVQILRGYGRQAGAAALAEAAGSQTAVLGQLLPELGAAGEQAGSGSWARFALFEAVCTVLDRAAQDAPLVVILDDLHAAGRPSVLLLRFAAAARLSRVLLLATYRSAEARLDPDVSDVIAALEPAGTPLPLAALSRDEIQLMLPGADTEVLALVERRGEGNPLFVAQVARLLGHGAATVDEVPVPVSIRQAVRRQVARLGETAARAAGDDAMAAEEVLATAAAIGPGIDPILVAAVLGAPAGLVTRLCDNATEIGLLSPGRDAGELYRFRHALIRETLYAGLAPQSRAQAHHRIAGALEARTGRSHSELAYHFLRAAPGGEAAAKAMTYSQLAGQDALKALAYEEAASHFRHALDALGRAAQATPASRCELLLSLAEALTKTGPDPAATRVLDEAVRLARQANEPRMLATAALLSAQHLDFNAPADAAIAVLREAAEALDPADDALRARALARLAITLAAEPPAARAAAEQAVRSAREAISRDPDGRAAATALATSLTAQHHVLWGTRDPRNALADADEIVAAAQRAHEPETELDGRVLRLTHLLELGDGPSAQRVLPELDRLAESMRQPAARLAALSRRSTLAALAGDFGPAAEFARQAFQTGQAAGLPDAGAVYWGQLFAIWLHTGLPGRDEQLMEQLLRDLVARSYLSVAHAAALVQIDAAHGATEQARGRLGELVSTGMETLRPDMVHVWALTQLARGCTVLGTARHAPRIYQALAPYAGRTAVAAGAVTCAGSTDFYLAGLAVLNGDTTAAHRHYRTAVSCHRRLGAQPMLAHTLHEHALLLRQHGGAEDLAAASAALAEARAIATSCGMTKLLPLLDQPDAPSSAALTLNREDDFWIIGYAGARTRMPDSLGLRYLDLLVRSPSRELAAVELAQLAGATGAAGTRKRADDLHEVSSADADDVLDQQARDAYRRRLTELGEELAEAEEWNDIERASRLRAEREFLVRELTAATGLGGRSRRLGSESERARINVTRAIRSAISRIRDRAPDAAAHLDQTVRTGTRCSYSLPYSDRSLLRVIRPWAETGRLRVYRASWGFSLYRRRPERVILRSMAADQGHHDQPDGSQDRQAQLDQREVTVAQGEGQLAEREELLLQREQAVARREHAADERERLADEREASADRREEVADRREHGADEREGLADWRDGAADEREVRLDALEQRLDERARSAGLMAATIQERVHESVQRGRARLAASAARLDRSEAALDRANARNHRQQQEIQRATAASERQHGQVTVTDDPDPAALSERLAVLRQQLADAARKLAAAEDETARLHEEIAAQRPDRTLASRHIAEQARAVAQRAREIADNLSPAG